MALPPGIFCKKGVTFSDSFGAAMCKLAGKNDRVCAITAAMPGGTGLLEFQSIYPERLFDVGIAEEHAVSMAAGLAKQGMVPVVALYSTFLQRTYDMLMQDIGLLGLHVVLAVDRAGLVGEDGETHHGVFDVGFLRQVPGMQILCPASTAEQQDMLRWAVNECTGPVAIRYPRGGDRSFEGSGWPAKVYEHTKGKDAAILTYGTVVDEALAAAELLKEKGEDVAVVRMLSVAPLPIEELARVLKGKKHVLILEEACSGAALWQQLAWQLREVLPDVCITGMDLGAGFVTHGKVNELYRHCGIDARSVAQRLLEVMGNEG